MKRFFTLFLLGIITISCTKEYQPRTLETVTIKEFSIDSTSIRAIHPIDENTVYFAGSHGKTGFTKDGGKTWNMQTIKYKDSITPHFRSIAKNKNGTFVLSVANPALLYKIKDGATSLVYKEENKKVFYDAMQFFADGKHGIAVGDPTQDCASVILTADGGSTWRKLSCKNLPKFEEDEAFFAASNTNIKIIDDVVWICSGGKKSRILKSEDKGETWQIFDTPFIQGNGPQGMYSIDFANKNNGIAVGGDYSKPKENTNNKAITTNGGKTWKTVANGQNPGYKSCVQYVPNTNGKEVFAVGKTGISFSNDGGKTWKQVSKDGYYTIKFVDRNTAWLSGNKKLGKLVLP